MCPPLPICTTVCTVRVHLSVLMREEGGGAASPSTWLVKKEAVILSLRISTVVAGLQTIAVH
jgi:hypothetical protein